MPSNDVHQILHMDLPSVLISMILFDNLISLVLSLDNGIKVCTIQSDGKLVHKEIIPFECTAIKSINFQSDCYIYTKLQQLIRIYALKEADALNKYISNKEYLKAIEFMESNDYGTDEINKVKVLQIQAAIEDKKIEVAIAFLSSCYKQISKYDITNLFQLAIALSQLSHLIDALPIGIQDVQGIVVDSCITDHNHTALHQFITNHQPLDNFAIINKIKSVQDSKYNDCLILLYQLQKMYTEQFQLMIAVNHKNSLKPLIELANDKKEFVLNALIKYCTNLISIDPNTYITLLLSINPNQQNIEQIKQKLDAPSKCKFLYYLYLQSPKSIANYNELGVMLLENDQQLFIKYIQTCVELDILSLYNRCKQIKAYEAMFELSRKMGNATEPLKILVNELGNMEGALQYIVNCPNANTKESWDLVAKNSKKEDVSMILKYAEYSSVPALVVKLLNFTGCDCIESLYEFMIGIRCNISLYEVVKYISNEWKFKMLNALIQESSIGTPLQNKSCNICKGRLRGKIVLYRCMHASHMDCSINSKCNLCNSQQ